MENKLSIPIAIVVAGVLIAGAVFITKSSTTAPTNVPTPSSQTEDVTLAPLSEDDHILGSPRATILFFEYSDTECPFCKQFHTTLHKVIDTYGREGTVAWVYRHFPIQELHSKARKEAEATECIAELGGNDVFWKYVDRIYQVTPSNNGLDPVELPKLAEEVGVNKMAFENCLASGKFADLVERDYQDAIGAQGRGTPHSVLVLQKPLSSETLDLIRTASQQLPLRTLIVSTDQKKLVMVGALPFDLLKLIIDSVAKSP